MRFTKITIVKAGVPSTDNINDELQWLGASLGLFSLRDKDKSRFRIFVMLIKSLKAKKPLSSDEIAELLDLTRGTVVHHLNALMSAGLVSQNQNKYSLTVDSLEELVELVQNNLNKAMENLKKVAKNLDERLEL